MHVVLVVFKMCNCVNIQQVQDTTNVHQDVLQMKAHLDVLHGCRRSYKQINEEKNSKKVLVSVQVQAWKHDIF